MNFKLYFIILACLISSISCEPKKEKATNLTNIEINKADEIINEAIQAHGGDNYENHHYSFDFRGNTYSFIHQKELYTYSVKRKIKDDEIKDVLSNGVFSREINDVTTELSKSDETKFSLSLNSVIYFALLPYKLNDTSVHKKDKGITNIKGENYHTIQVTFDEIGGGEDHDDVFYYWINTVTKTVDYLAYKYHVNGGGIRFREAYNPQKVNNVLFQNYINYKVPTQIELKETPILFNQEKLIEVSRIELDNIKVIKS